MYSDVIKKSKLADRTVYSALEILKESGIVADKWERWPRAHYFTLTEKGKKAAALLLELEKVMGK